MFASRFFAVVGVMIEQALFIQRISRVSERVPEAQCRGRPCSETRLFSSCGVVGRARECAGEMRWEMSSIPSFRFYFDQATSCASCPGFNTSPIPVF